MREDLPRCGPMAGASARARSRGGGPRASSRARPGSLPLPARPAARPGAGPAGVPPGPPLRRRSKERGPGPARSGGGPRGEEEGPGPGPGSLGGLLGEGLLGVDPGQVAYGQLWAVAFLWGSYVPAIRWIFLHSDSMLSPAQVTFERMLISAVCLLACSAASRGAAGEGEGADAGAGGREGDKGGGWGRLLLFAGELSLWNFGGTALQAYGLEHTSATKVGFLMATATLFVPMLSMGIGGARVGREVWAMCALAFVGTVLIAGDAPGDPLASLQASAGLLGGDHSGDAVILLSAFFYALQTVRIGRIPEGLRALDVVTCKTAWIVLLSGFWLLKDGGSIGPDMFAGEGPAVTAMLAFSALFPGAIATTLQVNAQQRISPAQAQVVFSMTPIFTALVAAALIPGGERLGPLGWLGGLLIVGATVVGSGDPEGGRTVKGLSR